MNEEVEAIVTERGLIGYKILETSQNSDFLLSANNFLWKPGSVVTALCATHGPECRVSPECTCGIYAAKSMEHLEHIGYFPKFLEKRQFRVVCKVRLWGKILECQLGWRAEHAALEELYYVTSDPEHLEHLEHAAQYEVVYKVPVKVIEVPDKEPPYRNDDATQQARRTTPAPLTLDECLAFMALADELTPSELRLVKQRLYHLRYHKQRSLQNAHNQVLAWQTIVRRLTDELNAINAAHANQSKGAK